MSACVTCGNLVPEHDEGEKLFSHHSRTCWHPSCGRCLCPNPSQRPDTCAYVIICLNRELRLLFMVLASFAVMFWKKLEETIALTKCCHGTTFFPSLAKTFLVRFLIFLILLPCQARRAAYDAAIHTWLRDVHPPEFKPSEIGRSSARAAIK